MLLFLTLIVEQQKYFFKEFKGICLFYKDDSNRNNRLLRESWLRTFQCPYNLIKLCSVILLLAE